MTLTASDNLNKIIIITICLSLVYESCYKHTKFLCTKIGAKATPNLQPSAIIMLEKIMTSNHKMISGTNPKPNFLATILTFFQSFFKKREKKSLPSMTK